MDYYKYLSEENISKLNANPFSHKKGASSEEMSNWKRKASRALWTMFSVQAKTEDSFVNFWNSFEGNEAYLFHLFQVSEFYGYQDYLFTIAEKQLQSDYPDFEERTLSTTCLFFIMDAILIPDFQTFDAYLSSNIERIESLLKIYGVRSSVEKLKKDYFETFGSKRNIKSLLTNCLTQAEQIELVSGIMFSDEVPLNPYANSDNSSDMGDVMEEMSLKGMTHHVFCEQRKKANEICSSQCRLKDVENLSNYVSKLVDRLADMRASVVHRAWLVLFVTGYDKDFGQYVPLVDTIPGKNIERVRRYYTTMEKPKFRNMVLNALWSHLTKKVVMQTIL